MQGKNYIINFRLPYDTLFPNSVNILLTAIGGFRFSFIYIVKLIYNLNNYYILYYPCSVLVDELNKSCKNHRDT